MNGLPLAPSIMVDLSGSGLAIILAFMALRYSYFLVKLQPRNFLWGFLYYFSMAMAFFAISRGVGHILRQLLILSGNQQLWIKLSPYSGGFNTLMIISVSAVTIYYHKGLEAYKTIRREAVKLSTTNLKLEETAGELQKMNLHLEESVAARTRDLSESEKKFRHFFENSKDMVYFCDDGGKISDINDSGRRMLGVTELPKNLDLHHFFKDEAELNQYIETLKRKGFISDFEVEMKRDDGSVCHLLVTANALQDENGRMIGYEGIAKDMTRLKMITDQLISQVKMASVGQLAAGVAHEINTPLGIILGYAQLMQDDFTEESEERQNLIVIERQTKTCRKIVADLLKFSRQTVSEKSCMQLNDIIEEVISFTEHSLHMDHINVEKQLSVSLPPIHGDSEKLRQVFFNLINNAHHAMEKGGHLKISTFAADNGQAVNCVISDNGHGISRKDQDKIFDPFFTTKGVGKGTGLGLSVTYGIVSEHGGAITVESPSEDGTGTSFYVTLPIKQIDK